MKKIFIFLVPVTALFFPFALQAGQQELEWFPWAQSIMEETQSADFIYKIKSVFNTQHKRPSFAEVYRKLQKQVSISSQADLFLNRARQLNAALNENPIFKDYVFTVQFAADLGPNLTQSDFEYLHRFLSSPHTVKDFNSHYLPQEALHYENGTVFFRLVNPDSKAQDPIFLIVNPTSKTVEFVYSDPQFDRQALQGRSYRLW